LQFGHKILIFYQVEKDQQVQKLLEQGLYHYGHGEIGIAVELWKKVLELDPKNDVAREYLSIELGPAFEEKLSVKKKHIPTGKPPTHIPEQPKKSHRAEFSLGLQHLKAGKPEPAYSLFNALHDEEPDNPAYPAYIELSKTAIVKSFLKQVGDFGKVPVLKVSLSELTEYNLTEEQGFILSLINGETSLEDIIYLSPTPPFLTFSSLKHFLHTGLIVLKDKE